MQPQLAIADKLTKRFGEAVPPALDALTFTIAAGQVTGIVGPDAAGKTTRHPAVPSAHLVDLEKTIARQLGMRVQIRAAGKGKGRLIIHYATLDQFDEVLQKLGIKGE